jgi:hypothetical protein
MGSSALGVGHHPEGFPEVHIGPAHTAHLAEALAGQHEHLRDGPEGISEPFGGPPDRAQLLVAEYPRSDLDLVRPPERRCGVGLYQVPRQAPAQECMGPRAHLVGGACGAAGDRLIDERDDVPACDRVDAPVPPAGDQLRVENAPGPGSVLETREVQPPVVLDHLPHGIATAAGPGFLRGRIAAFGDG